MYHKSYLQTVEKIIIKIKSRKNYTQWKWGRTNVCTNYDNLHFVINIHTNVCVYDIVFGWIYCAKILDADDWNYISCVLILKVILKSMEKYLFYKNYTDTELKQSKLFLMKFYPI